MEGWYSVFLYMILIALGIGVLLSLIRAIRGPRIADRIVGVNMMGTMISAIIAVCAVLFRQSWLLDVCLVYVLISFLAAVVLSKNHIASHEEGEDEDV